MKTRFIKLPHAKAAIDRRSNGIKSEGDAHRIIAWLVRLDIAAARETFQLVVAHHSAHDPSSFSRGDYRKVSLALEPMGGGRIAERDRAMLERS